MRRELLPIEAEHYRSHPLHDAGTEWAETNCATDMWIEILHAWGLDPLPGLAFTVGVDFDGEQWTMFTYPEEDLRLLYGLEVHELNVWRPLIEHLEDHLALGHLVAVDVDAFHLPDTRGVTYRLAHQKTTVAAQMIDRSARRLGYFHNAGYAELEGDDFDALLHLGDHQDPLADALPPFAALVRLEGRRPDHPALLDDVRARLRLHLARRPLDNPVDRLAKRMTEDLGAIAAGGMDAFHRYAFGTCRHLGANGQLAAAFVTWLAERDPGADRPALEEAAQQFVSVASGAKGAEFTLARAAAGRSVDLAAVMAPVALAWEGAVSVIDDRYGA